MKNVLVFIIIMISTTHSYGLVTKQQDDILYYKGKKLNLETGWGHPSPLETYYAQKDIAYPFTVLHTANYRGHVATWKVDNGKLFITQIEIEEKRYQPHQFQIASANQSLNNKDEVLADWFSGLLVCNLVMKKSWKIIETYYIHIRKGAIIEVALLNDSDRKKIKELREQGNLNGDLMKKYRMLVLNNNYINYYFRLNTMDTVEVKDKPGYFVRRREGSPVLGYFSNDHLKWPFNWENFDKSGAANCKWTIQNDSIFLQEVGLLSGLDFYQVDKESVPLSEVFSTPSNINKVYAHWLSGVFKVEFGQYIENELLSGYKQFEPSEFVYFRISKGLIIESETVPVGFNIDKDTPKHLKKLIHDY